MNQLRVDRRKYGEFGQDNVELVEVDFEGGIAVEIISFGGIIKTLKVPILDGTRKNIVISLPNLDTYAEDAFFIGCLVGRFANRIKNGEFNIGNEKITLTKNHGNHHLHGGDRGFGKMNWEISSVEQQKETVAIELILSSADGAEGYPGNLEVIVLYVISRNEVKISYSAQSDKKSIFSPTNHSYFNLGGDFKSSIDDHRLGIDSDQILEVDDDLIPTGTLLSVEGTVFDFQEERYIGDSEYDHCYALKGRARLSNERTGVSMTIESDAPGIQLYTADHLSGDGLMKRSAVCLETQFFPDSPNIAHFQSPFIGEGEEVRTETTYRFELSDSEK